MIAAVSRSEYQKACEWIHRSGLKTLLCRQNLKNNNKELKQSLSSCAVQ